ncbi:MAG: hypothetical protein LVT47_08840 [Cyanobacteria bacterium LVE1205-1]|jgi:nickel transport protein
MKGFGRIGATVSLVGSVLAGTIWAGSLPVFGLPVAQILDRLRPIPVFTITNDQGVPLTASPRQGENRPPISPIFIGRGEAQIFLDRLKSTNPDLAKSVKVTPISMAEVFEIRQKSKGKAERLEFEYVPMQQQVASAKDLIKQAGAKPEQFQGTPLFFALAGAEKERFPVAIRQGDKSVIPLFFKKEDMQTIIEQFKKQQPNQAATLQVLAFPLPLEMVLYGWENEADEKFNKEVPFFKELGSQIVLVPPQESLEFVRTLSSGTQGKPNPQSSPSSNVRPTTTTSPKPSPSPTVKPSPTSPKPSPVKPK